MFAPHKPLARLVALTSICLLVGVSADVRPNFLFVAIDDLNDFCGFASEEPGNYLQTIYPDPAKRQAVSKILTPNIDRLAASGAPFLRSSSVSPLCGPSRTALLTGVPPHRSGYYQHREHFRLNKTLRDAVTLPQYLNSNGYFTAGLGKIFHTAKGSPTGPLKDDWADARNSWSRWVNVDIGCGEGRPTKYSPPGAGLMRFGPSKLETRDSGDWLAADFVARLLETGSAETVENRGSRQPQSLRLPGDRPFFLACGLFRPHLPFFAPQEYFDRFPTGDMTGLSPATLAAVVADTGDLPPGAERFSDYGDGKMKIVLSYGRRLDGATGETQAWRDTVQAYLACVSFADACVGRLLEGLEKSPYRENTVVVFWSDHGYHLGSKYHFAKQALWEEANRTLLVIQDPRIEASSGGVPRRQIVSLADLYPTVVDLAGLPARGEISGRSLRPLLEDAGAPELHGGILVTYQEGNHCLRTPTHRFMRYRDGSGELYDIIADPGQLENIVGATDQATLRKTLTAQLDRLLAD